MHRFIRPVTEIQMPSRADECSRLRKLVLLLATSVFRDREASADLELAIGEAFSNAVKFGKTNCRVCVRIESPAMRELAVEMEYPSDRFDTTIKLPEDLYNCTGGFGRYIMANVTDSLSYSFRDGYTTLRMTKRSS